jgi:hypothetical protein
MLLPRSYFTNETGAHNWGWRTQLNVYTSSGPRITPLLIQAKGALIQKHPT